MCASKPRIPPPPPPPQEVKQPDTVNSRRRKDNPAGMGAGTVLTSPSGIASSGLNLGGTTLLGS